MKYERFKHIRFCKIFIFIVAFAVGFSVLGFAGQNSVSLKANTNYYDNDLQYVVNDWQHYQSETKNGLTLVNNGDGTVTLYGTADATTDFYLPFTISTLDSSNYYNIFLALLRDNKYGSGDNQIRLYIGYNNGANITNYYVNYFNSSYYARVQPSANFSNLCAVLRFAQNTTFGSTGTVFTPFCFIKGAQNASDLSTNGQNQFHVSAINMMLGPQPASTIDLTKVNYIQEPINISLVISSQINKSFGNQLEEIMQYSFSAGDTVEVDTTGVASTTIDLLTMTDGAHLYKMTFINDALSNDYLNVYLYKDSTATIFYNNNVGELTAQNIIDFRIWGVDAIDNNATITSGSAFNNNLISKIYVYSTGTNYELGYSAGYNDARADIEEELQEAYGEGLAQGYQDGYTTGYGEGYDTGAIEGVDTSWLINLFGAIDTFFSIHLFPNLTFGTLFAIPFVLSIAWVIIRILRGGGYGD